MRRATTRPVRVIMVGPSPEAGGGIASVSRTLLHSSALSGGSVQHISTWGWGGVPANVCRTIYAAVRILLCARRDTIIHVHLASSGSTLRKSVVFLAARVRHLPTLIHLHGGGYERYLSNSFVGRWLAKWMFTKCDSVLVLSESWRLFVERELGRSDAVVMPNPVVVPPEPTDMVSPPSVLFVGHLQREKGVFDLVSAIAQLQEDGRTDIQWVLVGDDPKGEVRAIVQALPEPEMVRLTGWLRGHQVEDLLRHAWVFCLPSYMEGKPVALLEAMAHGLACVATPVGGIPELVISGRTGVIVPVGDTGALAMALGDLVAAPKTCRQLGSRGRDLIRRDYDALTVSQCLMVVYEGILAGLDSGNRRSSRVISGGCSNSKKVRR